MRDYDGDMDVFQEELSKAGITREQLDMTNFCGLTEDELKGIVRSAIESKKKVTISKINACEEAIKWKLFEISNLYKEAYPDANYLSLCVFCKEDRFSFNNAYSDDDKAFPVYRFGTWGSKDGTEEKEG